jgi:hypothetical protein
MEVNFTTRPFMAGNILAPTEQEAELKGYE